MIHSKPTGIQLPISSAKPQLTTTYPQQQLVRVVFYLASPELKLQCNKIEAKSFKTNLKPAFYVGESNKEIFPRNMNFVEK